jgi:hypothetical protein
MPPPLTKKQKAELRRLAGLAHERELSAAIRELDLEFERWKKGEISVFALNERIHKFHHGISRDLYALYDPRGAELTVPVQLPAVQCDRTKSIRPCCKI